jgi:hypothetical protein
MVRDELPPDAAVMLATIEQGVSIKHTFTTDRSTFLGSLATVPIPAAHLSLVEMLDKADHACEANPAAGAGGQQPAQSVISQAITVGKALIAETRQRQAPAESRSSIRTT